MTVKVQNIIIIFIKTLEVIPIIVVLPGIINVIKKIAVSVFE